MESSSAETRAAAIVTHQAALLVAHQAELGRFVEAYKARTGVDPLTAAAAAARVKKRRPGPADAGKIAKKRRMQEGPRAPLIPRMPPMTSVKQVKNFLAMARKKTSAVDRQTFCVALKDSATAAKAGFVSASGLELLKVWIKGALEGSHVPLLGLILKALMHLPITFTALKASKIARTVLYFSSSAPPGKGRAPHADAAIRKMADQLIVVWKQLSAKFQANKAALLRGDAQNAPVAEKKAAVSKAPSAAERRLAKIAAREHEALRLENERLKAARPTIALPKVSTALDGPAAEAAAAAAAATASASEGADGAPTKRRRVSWAPELEDVRPISPRVSKRAKKSDGKGDFHDALMQDKAKERELIDRELHKLPAMEARSDWVEPGELPVPPKDDDDDEVVVVSKEASRLARVYKMSVEVVYVRTAQVPTE
jgi:hypothetical protein